MNDEPLTLGNLAGGEAELRFQECLSEIKLHMDRDDLADTRRGKASITIKISLDIDKDTDHATVVLEECKVDKLPALKRPGRIARMKSGLFMVDSIETDVDGNRQLLVVPPKKGE